MPTKKQWHVYGKEHTSGDLAGVYATVVAGPTIKGPTELKRAGVSDMGMTYLASFDHEPSDLEKDQVQPRAFRQFHADGTEIDWDAYAFDSALECQRAGFHRKLLDDDGNCQTCGCGDEDPEGDILKAIASIQDD